MTKKAKFLCKQGSKTGGISPEVIFCRALNIAGCREDISLESVLSHPVGPVPSALFHDDGSMRKTTKSELGHKLEADVSKVTELPQHDKTSCVYIRDAMAAIQMMPGDSYSTCDSLASAYQRKLLVEFDKADTVFDVFDRYDNENSVKVGERERRVDAGEQEIPCNGWSTSSTMEKKCKCSFKQTGTRCFSLQVYGDECS